MGEMEVVAPNADMIPICSIRDILCNASFVHDDQVANVKDDTIDEEVSCMVYHYFSYASPDNWKIIQIPKIVSFLK